MPRYYDGFKVLNRNIDVIPLSADYSAYKLILAPNLRLVDDTTVKRLHAFVAGGGTLVLNDRAGTQHMDCSMRLALSPGPFTDMTGVRSVAMLDLVEYNAQNGMLEKSLQDELGIVFTGSDTVFKPRTIVESLKLGGAEAIAVVRGAGELTGRPAVTRNRYRQGWVYYAGVDSDDEGFYEALAQLVGATSRLTPLIAAPSGVEVTSRQDANATYYFLLNMTDMAHKNIELPHPMYDLIAERAGVTQVSLGPLDVAVLAWS